MHMLLEAIDKECVLQKLTERIAAGDSLRAFLNASLTLHPTPPRETSALGRQVLPFISESVHSSDLADSDVGGPIVKAHDHETASPSKHIQVVAEINTAKALSIQGAENLEVMLQGDDLTFMNSLYNTLLLRAPDEGGLESYLARLERGIEREVIVAEVANSEEGQKIGARLDGLDSLLKSQKPVEKKGVMSWFSMRP